MTKKFWAKFAIISFIVLALGISVYLYFPKILEEVIYPLDYEEYIIKYSKENNIDTTLVASIIFAESRYNPNSVSRVGAIGLMQIMPSTGASIAKYIGDKNYSPSKLYDPETNICYGSWYIKSLIDMYGGDVNAALAAYNGGQVAGDRYVMAGEANIPNETKSFIKTVNTAKEMYQKLYGSVLTSENIAERLKIKQETEPKFTKKIIDFFQKVLYGR